MQHIVLKEKLFGVDNGKAMAALCFEFTDGTVQLSYLNHAANFTNLDGFFLSGPVWVASPFDMLISSSSSSPRFLSVHVDAPSRKQSGHGDSTLLLHRGARWGTRLHRTSTTGGLFALSRRRPSTELCRCRCGHTTCETTEVVRAGCAFEGSGLDLSGGFGHGHGVVGVKDVVNHVDDTVRDEDVWDEDFGAVDEDVAVGDGDSEVAASEGGDGHVVLKHGTVGYSAVDNCVRLLVDACMVRMGRLEDKGDIP